MKNWNITDQQKQSYVDASGHFEFEEIAEEWIQKQKEWENGGRAHGKQD